MERNSCGESKDAVDESMDIFSELSAAEADAVRNLNDRQLRCAKRLCEQREREDEAWRREFAEKLQGLYDELDGEKRASLFNDMAMERYIPPDADIPENLALIEMRFLDEGHITDIFFAPVSGKMQDLDVPERLAQNLLDLYALAEDDVFEKVGAIAVEIQKASIEMLKSGLSGVCPGDTRWEIRKVGKTEALEDLEEYISNMDEDCLRNIEQPGPA